MIEFVIVVMLLAILFVLGCSIYVAVAALKEIREVKKILKKDPIDKVFQSYKFKDPYEQNRKITYEEMFGYTE